MEEFIIVTEFLDINRQSQIKKDSEENCFAYFITYYIPIIGESELYSIHFSVTTNIFNGQQLDYISLSDDIEEYDCDNDDEAIHQFKQKIQENKNNKYENLFNYQSCLIKEISNETNIYIDYCHLLNIDNGNLIAKIFNDLEKTIDNSETLNRISHIFKLNEFSEFKNKLKNEFFSNQNIFSSAIENPTLTSYTLSFPQQFVKCYHNLSLFQNKIDLSKKIANIFHDENIKKSTNKI